MLVRISSIALTACLAAACSQESPEPAASRPAETAPAAAAAPAPAPTVDATAEATRIFSERCTTCHGPEGAGDGPASAGLTPPPRNFHDPSWQQSVTDQHIEQIIQFGGAAVGKSTAMPSNPDLMSKPAVVAALRAHIRELGR